MRGQQPDEPPPAPILRPTPLRIPSPQELGVAEARQVENPKLDWTAVHSLLDRLGATCFHLEHMGAGYRVTCLLPTHQPGRTHCIEAEATTEAEAVRLALTKMQQWAGAGR